MLDPFVRQVNSSRRRRRSRLRESIQQRTEVRSKTWPDDQRSQRLRKHVLYVLSLSSLRHLVEGKVVQDSRCDAL
jgi:hypothetical protein